MHTYDSDDSDCYYCDECDSLIFGLVYNKNGKSYEPKSKARSANEHFCYGCCFGSGE